MALAAPQDGYTQYIYDIADYKRTERQFRSLKHAELLHEKGMKEMKKMVMEWGDNPLSKLKRGIGEVFLVLREYTLRDQALHQLTPQTMYEEITQMTQTILEHFRRRGGNQKFWPKADDAKMMPLNHMQSLCIVGYTICPTQLVPHYLCHRAVQYCDAILQRFKRLHQSDGKGVQPDSFVYLTFHNVLILNFRHFLSDESIRSLFDILKHSLPAEQFCTVHKGHCKIKEFGVMTVQAGDNDEEFQIDSALVHTDGIVNDCMFSPWCHEMSYYVQCCICCVRV